MKELRCHKCNKLLATVELKEITNDFDVIKIKCTRCKEMNRFLNGHVSDYKPI